MLGFTMCYGRNKDSIASVFHPNYFYDTISKIQSDYILRGHDTRSFWDDASDFSLCLQYFEAVTDKAKRRNSKSISVRGFKQFSVADDKELYNVSCSFAGDILGRLLADALVSNHRRNENTTTAIPLSHLRAESCRLVFRCFIENGYSHDTVSWCQEDEDLWQERLRDCQRRVIKTLRDFQETLHAPFSVFKSHDKETPHLMFHTAPVGIGKTYAAYSNFIQAATSPFASQQYRHMNLLYVAENHRQIDKGSEQSLLREAGVNVVKVHPYAHQIFSTQARPVIQSMLHDINHFFKKMPHHETDKMEIFLNNEKSMDKKRNKYDVEKLIESCLKSLSRYDEFVKHKDTAHTIIETYQKEANNNIRKLFFYFCRFNMNPNEKCIEKTRERYIQKGGEWFRNCIKTSNGDITHKTFGFFDANKTRKQLTDFYASLFYRYCHLFLPLEIARWSSTALIMTASKNLVKIRYIQRNDEDEGKTIVKTGYPEFVIGGSSFRLGKKDEGELLDYDDVYNDSDDEEDETVEVLEDIRKLEEPVNPEKFRALMRKLLAYDTLNPFTCASGEKPIFWSVIMDEEDTSLVNTFKTYHDIRFSMDSMIKKPLDDTNHNVLPIIKGLQEILHHRSDSDEEIQKGCRVFWEGVVNMCHDSVHDTCHDEFFGLNDNEDTKTQVERVLIQIIKRLHGSDKPLRAHRDSGYHDLLSAFNHRMYHSQGTVKMNRLLQEFALVLPDKHDDENTDFMMAEGLMLYRRPAHVKHEDWKTNALIEKGVVHEKASGRLVTLFSLMKLYVATCSCVTTQSKTSGLLRRLHEIHNCREAPNNPLYDVANVQNRTRSVFHNLIEALHKGLHEDRDTDDVVSLMSFIKPISALLIRPVHIDDKGTVTLRPSIDEISWSPEFKRTVMLNNPYLQLVSMSATQNASSRLYSQLCIHYFQEIVKLNITSTWPETMGVSRGPIGTVHMLSHQDYAENAQNIQKFRKLHRDIVMTSLSHDGYKRFRETQPIETQHSKKNWKTAEKTPATKELLCRVISTSKDKTSEYKKMEHENAYHGVEYALAKGLNCLIFSRSNAPSHALKNALKHRWDEASSQDKKLTILPDGTKAPKASLILTDNDERKFPCYTGVIQHVEDNADNPLCLVLVPNITDCKENAFPKTTILIMDASLSSDVVENVLSTTPRHERVIILTSYASGGVGISPVLGKGDERRDFDAVMLTTLPHYNSLNQRVQMFSSDTIKEHYEKRDREYLAPYNRYIAARTHAYVNKRTLQEQYYQMLDVDADAGRLNRNVVLQCLGRVERDCFVGQHTEIIVCDNIMGDVRHMFADIDIDCQQPHVVAQYAAEYFQGDDDVRERILALKGYQGLSPVSETLKNICIRQLKEYEWIDDALERQNEPNREVIDATKTLFHNIMPLYREKGPKGRKEGFEARYFKEVNMVLRSLVLTDYKPEDEHKKPVTVTQFIKDALVARNKSGKKTQERSQSIECLAQCRNNAVIDFSSLSGHTDIAFMFSYYGGHFYNLNIGLNRERNHEYQSRINANSLSRVLSTHILGLDFYSIRNGLAQTWRYYELANDTKAPDKKLVAKLSEWEKRGASFAGEVYKDKQVRFLTDLENRSIALNDIFKRMSAEKTLITPELWPLLQGNEGESVAQKLLSIFFDATPLDTRDESFGHVLKNAHEAYEFEEVYDFYYHVGNRLIALDVKNMEGTVLGEERETHMSHEKSMDKADKTHKKAQRLREAVRDGITVHPVYLNMRPNTNPNVNFEDDGSHPLFQNENIHFMYAFSRIEHGIMINPKLNTLFTGE